MFVWSLTWVNITPFCLYPLLFHPDLVACHDHNTRYDGQTQEQVQALVLIYFLLSLSVLNLKLRSS